MGWYGRPPSQEQIDAVTIAAKDDRICALEHQVSLGEKRKRDAIDSIWREAVKLLDNPNLSRKRFKQRLWVVILKAESPAVNTR
jgi:hypothetical protein